MAKREEDVSVYETRSVKIMYMLPSGGTYYSKLINSNTRNSNDVSTSLRVAVIKPHSGGRMIGYDDGSKIYLLGNSKLYSYSGIVSYNLRSVEPATIPNYVVSRFPQIASQAGNNIYSYMDYLDYGKSGA